MVLVRKCYYGEDGGWTRYPGPPCSQTPNNCVDVRQSTMLVCVARASSMSVEGDAEDMKLSGRSGLVQNEVRVDGQD